MQQDFADEIYRLADAPVPELLRIYLQLFGKPARSRNRQHLFRTIVWGVQARDSTGLSKEATRRARELMDPTDLRVSSATTVPGRSRKHASNLTPGTVITRQYKGKLFEVRVLEDGFELDGQRFRSLSAVAKCVTGAHWNGKLFFRVQSASKRGRP